MHSSYLIRKTVKTPEDLVLFLQSFTYIDADISGDNGDEYLWDDARKAGYNTNAEFLANYVVENNKGASVKECAKAFTEEWLSRDSYYEDMKLETLEVEPDEYVGILMFT